MQYFYEERKRNRLRLYAIPRAATKKSSKTVNEMNNGGSVCRLTFCGVLYYFTFMIISANYFRTDKVL